MPNCPKCKECKECSSSKCSLKHNRCIRCLNRAIEGGFFNYPLMTYDAYFDTVRNDIGFQNVLEIAKNKHLAFKKELF